MTVSERVKYAVRAASNIHVQGPHPNIFLFATARGGSTWLMEIIASQPGLKYYDEPLNIRRPNVAHTGLFRSWESLMPDTGDPERVIRYLNALAAGKYRFMNPAPFRPNHRFLTNRIIFKIHEVGHLIGQIARRCNGQIVYLIRHPIPTTLSRKEFPRLKAFLESRYYDELLGATAKREIARIAATNDHLRRGIVAWCYDNLVALNHADFESLLVSYEELTLNPDPSAQLLLTRLGLSDLPAMRRAFGRPSHNINMSSAETQSVLASERDENRRRMYLVSKWTGKVSETDRADVSAIMQLFGLDTYLGDRLLPHARYLHFSETPAIAGEAHSQ